MISPDSKIMKVTFSKLSEYTNSGLVLAVLGNDDFYSFTKSVLNQPGVHDLYNQSLSTDELYFIGLESSTKGPAFFLHDEEDFSTHLKYQIKHANDKKLIIVSHAPPHRILDRGIRFSDSSENTHNISSTALRDFIEENQVHLVICGHCHSNGGRFEKNKDTIVVNVASHDTPRAFGNLCLIEILKDGEIKIEFHSTKDLIPYGSPMRLHGIGPYYCERLRSCGIYTIEELTNVGDLNRASSESGISISYLNKFQARAYSYLNSELVQISQFHEPDYQPIFFDIETDIACERVWLRGLLIDGDFIQLFADDWSKEKEILEKFIEILYVFSSMIFYVKIKP